MTMINLLTAEWTLFQAYYLFLLWTKGWFNSPTLGGTILIVGLSLGTILLGSASVFTNHKTVTYLSFLWKSQISKPANLVLITIILALFWSSISLWKGSPFQKFSRYQEVFLFLTLFSIQLWLFPILEKHNRTTDLVDRLNSNVWLVVIFLISTLAKVMFITPIVHNLVFNFDSFQYWSMAERMFRSNFNILEFNHYPPLYPLLLSPLLGLGEFNSLQNISIFNAIISSTAIFPVFLISRQFLNKTLSVLLAIVCAIFPFQIVYPSLLASENLAYPLFLWAVYFVFTYPENPRLLILWDLLAGISIGALWLTRYQTMVMIPVFLLTWWLKPCSGREEISIRPSWKKMFRLGLISLTVLIVFSPWAVIGLSNGLSIRQVIGTQIYSDVFPGGRDIFDLFFWSGITLAYFFLLAAPVGIFATSLISNWKVLLQDKELTRWMIFILSIAAVLFVTVTNHAWRATYNYPVPNRLLGRYVLYLSVLVWITAVVILLRSIQYQRKWILLTGIAVFGTSLICFQLFTNSSWILPRNILYYIFVDGYLPQLMPITYFILLIYSISIPLYWISNNRNQIASGFLLGLLAIIFVWSYPAYYEKMVDMNLYGKHLNSLIQVLIPRLEQSNIAIDSVKWFNPEDGFSIEKELIVRGFDFQGVKAKLLSGNPASEYKCKTRLMAQLPDGTRLAVIENNESCTFPADQWLSNYRMNQVDYAVVDLTK